MIRERIFTCLATMVAFLFRSTFAMKIFLWSKRWKSRPLHRLVARGGKQGRSIGIWRYGADGSWVRDPAKSSEWRCWADVEAIPPKRAGRKRIVLIGESAARGYFFDPSLTPAMCLQRCLDGAIPETFEVVDLARIDIDQFSLLNLMTSARDLEPDLVIFWAGNNWLNFGEYGLDHIRYLLAYNQDIYHQSKNVFQQDVLPKTAKRILSVLSEIASDREMRSIVVVPEWNLLDWEDESGCTPPYLANESHPEWSVFKLEAEKALACGDNSASLQAAESMSRIDGGLGSASFRLMGLAHLRAGDSGKARRFLEMARDALVGVPVPVVPRCPFTLQTALRTQALEQGMAVVDQRELFEKAFGQVPGKTVFMDYCHLTLPAIETTTKALASEICRQIGLPAECAQRGAFTGIMDPKEQAMAHVMAAMHNAHYGQPYSTILHHCRRALELEPKVAADFQKFLDFINRKASRWLCETFGELSRSPIVNRYLHPRSPNEWDKFEDSLLSNALVEALESVSDDARAGFTDFLIQEHFRPRSIVNLLNYQYSCPTFKSRVGHSFGLVPAYFRSFWQESSFLLISDGFSSATISLTYRVCGNPLAGEMVVVLVNEREHAHLRPSAIWRRECLEIPIRMLQKGPNSLRLKWPRQRFPWRKHRRKIESEIALARVPTALPTFGAIYHCSAKMN